MANLVSMHRRIQRKKYKKSYRELVALSDSLKLARSKGVTDERIKEIADSIPQNENTIRVYREQIENEIEKIDTRGVELQACPECNGRGEIEWTGSQSDPYNPEIAIPVPMHGVCPTCNGERFI